MDPENDDNFDDRLDNIMSTLEKDPKLQDDQSTNTSASATDPAADSTTEPPKKDAIGEDQDKKTSEGDKDQTQQNAAAIEPPTSWPTDDKEAFKALPSWAQERIVARENEREAHFSERTRTIAARERELSDIQARTTQAQAHYAQELERINSLSTQLLPAKFSDIRNEADYLKLKVEDPARASEYEAFVQVLRNAQQQQAQLAQARTQEHLNREFATLQEKYPEFKDTTKATAVLNDVRKACVDYYGFTAEEVQVIADHRHVPIIRDALAWRKHQAEVKAAQGKKIPAAQPRAVLSGSGSNSAGTVSAEQKNKILNRARQATDTRSKADLIASLL